MAIAGVGAVPPVSGGCGKTAEVQQAVAAAPSHCGASGADASLAAAQADAGASATPAPAGKVLGTAADQAQAGAGSIGTRPKGGASTTASQAAPAVTAKNAVGNAASKEAPGPLRRGAYTGARDGVIASMRERETEIRQEMQAGGVTPAKRAQLQQELQAVREDRRNMEAADWLTTIAHASGADADVVKALDESEIEVASDAEMSSDAVFDEGRGVIQVRESVMKQVLSDVDRLAARDVVDKTGRKVTDPNKLRKSQEYHGMVVTQALIGAHEAQHAKEADHTHGPTAANMQLRQAIYELDNMSGNSGAREAERQVILNYIDQYEYSAYNAQEKYQWDMGAAPKSMKWLTIDNNGRPLPREQAVENIYKFLRKDGFNADNVREATGVPAPEQAGRRIPGEDLEDRRIPGQELQGRRIPGQDLEGRRIPGQELEGRRIPGQELEGRRIPGQELEGRRIPGNQLEGRRIPGRRIP